MKVPVVVIGAGACGLTAALAAKDAGQEVLVLERDATPSGSTALSSGFVPAAGTRYQRAAGIDDAPELFAADVMRKNHGEADSRVVDALCRGVGTTLEWLDDRHGVRFDVLQGFTYPGHSRMRMHAVAEKTGAALMAALLRACADVDILTSARVTDVSPEEVVFERPDGKRERVEFDALVLACSGFGGNKELVRRYLPEVADALYFGHVGNQGDAVRWGTALGAQATDMTAYQGHGSVATPHGILVTWALMTEGGIQVNESGERFSNEHLGYSEQCLPVLRQPGGVAWCIYDERLHQLGMTFPDYRDAHAAGAVKLNPSFPRLTETLKDVRAYASGGQDPFGRDFSTKPLLAPPYYAVKVTGALFHTQGGLVIDEQARVLPLRNVFAGGGAARGVSGAHVWGYLSGNGLLSAVGLGRIAGENAARFTLRCSAT
ncbi:MAG: fumarate reductase flavoprotein subunit [Betaproteobacteria bacterium]|nr:fumarate reductase flavoprotein subunit [Betaproteobacteria bacterium]